MPMTKQETTRILAALEAHVPEKFERLNKAVKDNMHKLWAARFAEYDYGVIGKAVMNYIDNDVWGKMPTIGAIKEEARKIMYPDELTEQEAVNIILSKLSWRSAKEAFASLPPVLQKVVGNPGQLSTWGYMELDTVQSVIASNIGRSLRVLLDQERQKQRTGQARPYIKDQIEAAPVKQIESVDVEVRTVTEQKEITLAGIKKAMEALNNGRR